MKITKKQFNKAKKLFSKEGLSGIQKSTMLSSIYGDIEQVFSQPVINPSNSYPTFFYSTLFRKKAFVIAGITLLIVISGTTYVSAYSLPGDFLYGLKVKVIEPIGLGIRLTEESKNEYKLSLLQKRIDELEQLKEEEKLTSESQKKNSNAASKNIKDLKKSAIFDEVGENVHVSEKVKEYNSLIKKDLEIETNITENVNDTGERLDVKINKNIKGSTDINRDTNLEKGVIPGVKNIDTENLSQESNKSVRAVEVIEKMNVTEDTKIKIPGL